MKSKKNEILGKFQDKRKSCLENFLDKNFEKKIYVKNVKNSNENSCLGRKKNLSKLKMFRPFFDLQIKTK